MERRKTQLETIGVLRVEGIGTPKPHESGQVPNLAPTSTRKRSRKDNPETNKRPAEVTHSQKSPARKPARYIKNGFHQTEDIKKYSHPVRQSHDPNSKNQRAQTASPARPPLPCCEAFTSAYDYFQPHHSHHFAPSVRHCSRGSASSSSWTLHPDRCPPCADECICRTDGGRCSLSTSEL